MLTDEQAAIIDFAKNAEDDVVILVAAVAGAGKTFLLTELARQVKHKTGIYLAYNKSVALEAAGKFPISIACSTTHSLAYQATVKRYKLKVGSFSYKSITEKIPYEAKLGIVTAIQEFCLSKHLSLVDFLTERQHPHIKLCQKYMEAMWSGTIECSHDFYLKVFHLQLADNQITYAKQGILMVDEAGDLNEVTLEIFKLLPAKVKIAVGDEAQNIYGFNYTINAFEELKDNATKFSLTQSFRVAEHIAARIEPFCKTYINEEISFKGIPLPSNTDIKTHAFIGRTNSALINVIKTFYVDKTEFKLLRKAAEVFKIPLILCFLKYQGQVFDNQFKFIQEDFNTWHESTKLKAEFKSFFAYLTFLYEEDRVLSSAIRVVRELGKDLVMTLFDYAKKMESGRSSCCLATAHSVKGLEFDSVTILEDLNSAVATAKTDEVMSEEDKLQLYNLYYVACSRARVRLNNATEL